MKFTSEVLLQLISTAVVILVLWGVKSCLMKEEAGDELNHELMLRLKEFSETIYNHCLYVGEISEAAAKEIHAKEQIAYLGGCYHEVGRLRGKDYISSGIELLNEYAVSARIVTVVKEHNIHCDKPTSKEAAIVMLTDSVISTIQYLRTKEPGSQITIEALIKAIFNKRKAMGLLELSGLSEEELEQLQAYFTRTFCDK